MELLKGMMLGDGSLSFNQKYPQFIIIMTNVTFLGWLQTELGWLSETLSVKRIASEGAKHISNSLSENIDESNCLDTYQFSIKSHPQFEQFGQWYNTGEIVFPKNLLVSPTALKVWYVSDGTLKWDSRYDSKNIRFASLNESNRPDAIVSALEKHGFTVGHSGKVFRLSTSDTEDFFELIGDPVPGFKYKWAYQDRERYKRLKEQHREQHCTQTLE